MFNLFKKILSRLLIEKIIKYRNVNRNNKNAFMYTWMHDISGTEYLRNGSWEWNNIKNIKFLVDTQQVKNHLFIDVGANIGYFSCNLLNNFKNIFAFEPNPIAHYVLKANILNNVKIQRTNANIKTFEMGIGSKHEFLNINSDVIHNAMGKITKNESINSFPVEIKTLDSLFEEMDDFSHSQISLVKIDVEGFEIEVLQGMKNILKVSNPIIAIEMMNLKQNNLITNFLEENGYKFYYAYRRRFFHNLLGIPPIMKNIKKELFDQKSLTINLFFKISSHLEITVLRNANF
ncbi:MAG: FkbM family methyltransferase [Prochlorococcus marinus CUG1437]|nr:FkbM family methyltransferase [Prochlorococcus marinus CUG1437]